MSTLAPSVSLREPPPSRREALDGFTLFTLTLAYFVSSLTLLCKKGLSRRRHALLFNVFIKDSYKNPQNFEKGFGRDALEGGKGVEIDPTRTDQR